MGRTIPVIFCLLVCEYILAGHGHRRDEETGVHVCPSLGMHHHRSANGEDGSRIVFCRNSTDGTVRGVTHIGHNQVRLVVHVQSYFILR